MEDKTIILQEDTTKECQVGVPVNNQETDTFEGSKMAESRVNGELVSDDEHPDENYVCENGEKENMDGPLEETPASIVQQKSIIEQEAKPILGISGVKRKAETLERTSEEETLGKWHCSLCEISTTSEEHLNNHIQGKKHKAKEATSKSNDTPSITSMDLDPSDNSAHPNVDPTNGAGITEGDQIPVVKKWHCSLCQVSATSEATLNSHFLGKKHKAKEAKIKLDPKMDKKNGSENVKNEAISKWHCSVCQVYAASENNLQDHFQGKKHKAKEVGTNPPELEKTSESEQKVKEIPSTLHNGGETGKFWHCKMCNEETRDEGSMNAHRKSDKHRKALEENCGGLIVVSRAMITAVGKGEEVAQE